MSATDHTFAAPSGWSDDAASDPDLAGTDLTGGDVEDTDLAVIAAELGATTVETTAVTIDGRPGWVSHHRLDFTGKDVDGLRKQAKDRKFTEGVDGVKFSALLLGLTCVKLTRHGKDLELGGRTLTYANPDFQATLGTQGVHATVRQVYGGRDGLIDAAAKKVMTDAGWGQDAADPTQ